MPSQREQYGSTVHLFIGTGRSPCKFTSMPFTLGSNSIAIHRGPNSLFIFKSVSFSATTPKLSRSHLRRCINLRITLGFFYCDIDLSPKIPVHTLYSRNTVKSCFWGPSEAEGPQQAQSIFIPARAMAGEVIGRESRRHPGLPWNGLAGNAEWFTREEDKLMCGPGHSVGHGTRDGWAAPGGEVGPPRHENGPAPVLLYFPFFVFLSYFKFISNQV
jgi:hypothetical protein